MGQVCKVAKVNNVLGPSVWEDPGECWSHAQLDGFLQLLQLAKKSGKYVPDPLIPLQVAPCRATFYNYFHDWIKHG